MQDRKIWGAFTLLALIWGTSFFFIKIGLRTLQPMTLVAGRLTIGLAAVVVLLRWQKQSWPRGWEQWRHFLLLGALNTALPFVLFTWSESGPRGIDSSLASIMNSMAPLFTILLAGFVWRTEEVTGGKLMGLALGFGGVLVLFGRNLQGEFGDLSHLLAAMSAAVCYALASIYAKQHLRGLHPISVAAAQILVAATLVWAAALSLEDLGQQSLPWLTLGALLWLGILGSALAYTLYFYILARWGATQTTLVTYVLPVVGVTAGLVILNEPFDWVLLGGGLLILSGVWVVNWRPPRAAA